MEKAVSHYGLPNGYIIGQEGSGAIIGGLRYGDGVLYTKTEGQPQVYWQGPSIGWDFGGDGNRTMMLVYDLPNSLAIYRRYAGVNGSAYLVGGLGMTVLANTETPERTVYVVPIRSGVGVRLGMNVGYLKFTPQPHLEPVLMCSGAAACPIRHTVRGSDAIRGQFGVAPRPPSVAGQDSLL